MMMTCSDDSRLVCLEVVWSKSEKSGRGVGLRTVYVQARETRRDLPFVIWDDTGCVPPTIAILNREKNLTFTDI